MGKPWFFEQLKVGTYYGTNELKVFFACPGCEKICEFDAWESEEDEPLCVAGFVCECGYEITREEVEEWTNIPYDIELAKAHRRKHGW
jgi:hypothetical protein